MLFLFKPVGSENTQTLNLLMVSYFHVSILFDPKFAYNNVMHTARRIRPCVGFVVPKGKE